MKVMSSRIAARSAGAMLAAITVVAPGDAACDARQTSAASTEHLRCPVPSNLLERLPSSGPVPPIIKAEAGNSAGELPSTIAAEDLMGERCERALRDLVHRSLRSSRSEGRSAGLAEIRKMTDPACFGAMIRILGAESTDVRAAMLDHFSQSGDAGQAALAYIAISHADLLLRSAAGERIARPACDSVLRVVDQALRSPRHEIAGNAAKLTANMNIIAAIPALIMAQAVDDRAGDKGDLAWISVGTTRSYVANVIPIAGGNSGAFAPVIDQVFEGVLLRIPDAVVVFERADVHDTLVSMTSADVGESTAHLGRDRREWWAWFNDRYVPFKQAQAEECDRIARIEQALADQKRTSSDPPPPPEAPVVKP